MRFVASFHLMATVCCAAGLPSLMPMPRAITPQDGKLPITGYFSAAATGYSDARLQGAIDRLVSRVFRQTGLIPIGPKPAAAQSATLRVDCSAAGPPYPTLGENESYTLDVNGEAALLKAQTVDGALRGLATFAQLVTPDASGFQVSAMHIEDRPRFQWRGLMLDVSRHWMPIEVVERNLDAMAAVKLNVFHWHLSDDQGFRAESMVYPKLQGNGSDGNFYTQAQMRHIVQYARDRGIRVIPEFDIPGHTTSWFPGYPELASAAGTYDIGRHFGVFDPCIDPTKEWTYQFLDKFIGEMAAIFPDPYFHIGGDEVNGKQWNASQSIQTFMKEHNLPDNNALQAYFNQRVVQILAKYGKTMVGWDEILHPDLPKSAVIQSWRGQASLSQAAAQGYRGLLSWGYYLDHLSPASLHYAVDPLAGAAAQLTPEQSARILGGEACMWAELISSETVDSRIWPRTAAIAERFWSAPDVTNVDSMYDRMAVVSRELEWTGVRHRANYGPMLARLSAERPAPPVQLLADVSEALGLGPRRSSRYTTLQPLNRFVDAVRPESERVRALENTAARFLASPDANSADAEMLRREFRLWVDNNRQFEAMADGDVFLMELKPLSKDLAQLGSLGLRALEYLAAKNAPGGWAADQAKEIERIQKPNAEVRLAAFRPVKLLVDGLK